MTRAAPRGPPDVAAPARAPPSEWLAAAPPLIARRSGVYDPLPGRAVSSSFSIIEERPECSIATIGSHTLDRFEGSADYTRGATLPPPASRDRIQAALGYMMERMR